jgi:LacI family transcriptional regulator
MPRSKKHGRANHPKQDENSISLKELAAHLGLSPATVSFVVNGSAMADTLAPETRALILKAARKFGYRADFFARCLRTRRSFTIGVMVPEASAGYNVTVLSGIEDYLLQEEYFYGSEREFGKLCILRGFLKNEEFGLGCG